MEDKIRRKVIINNEDMKTIEYQFEQGTGCYLNIYMVPNTTAKLKKKIKQKNLVQL